MRWARGARELVSHAEMVQWIEKTFGSREPQNIGLTSGRYDWTRHDDARTRSFRVEVPS